MIKDLHILFKENGGLIVICFLLMFFSVFGQSLFFGVYLPMIQADLDLSKTAVGSLYAIATITSSIVIIYTAKGLDHMPLRNFIAIVLTGLAIGCFSLSLATSGFTLLIAFFLLRHFGQGLMTLSASASINRYLEKGRGKAVAFSSFGLSFQIIIFPLLGLSLNEYIHWQTAWAFYGVFILIVLLPSFWTYLKNHQTTRHAAWESQIKKQEEEKDINKAVRQWTRLDVLKDWRIYAILSITMLSPFVGTAIFFYQAELANSLSMSQLTFATAFPFFTVAMVTSSLVAGTVIDIYGEKPALVAYPIVYSLGLFFITRDWGLAVTYLGMVMLGGGGGIMVTTGGPLLANLYGTKYLSSVKSITFSMAILASALSPFIFGFLLDNGYEIRTLFSWVIVYSSVIWVLAFPICAKESKRF